MEEPELVRARMAAVSVAASLNLPAEDAVVVFNSNKLALRLAPCDVLARVTRVGLEGEARLELHRARQLAGAGCPVGAVVPRVAPLVYEHDGFAVTLWAYYDSSIHPVCQRRVKTDPLATDENGPPSGQLGPAEFAKVGLCLGWSVCISAWVSRSSRLPSAS